MPETFSANKLVAGANFRKEGKVTDMINTLSPR